MNSKILCICPYCDTNMKYEKLIIHIKNKNCIKHKYKLKYQKPKILNSLPSNSDGFFG